MTDDELDLLKAGLDAKLTPENSNVGIKFGEAAYRGFARRGWLSPATFTAFGTGAFPIKLPSYGGTHYAVPDFDLGDTEVIVGKS